ncbi:SH3-domain-containing protein [Aspergillus ellipticus CBS 707.79]|uniref:SH3-domain-containing protein n=1 Tax=Aspergillus ellipticus CBS 707.79 TaxID=1448320 RepID=A0A319E0X6_9EURO|nr:SH3-domain-containing protein [Aspergillus ellipticus CBS 707.79]
MPPQNKLPAVAAPIPPKPAFDTKPAPVYDTKPKPRLSNMPSSSSLTATYRSQVQSQSQSLPQTTASSPGSSSYRTAPSHSPSIPSPSPALSSGTSVAARADYFSRQPNLIRAPSPGVSAIAAAKKKPPPPPPPRMNSAPALYVTAVHDFAGQSAEDLAFREGDRIRVLKKTDSTDDWWEGELRGKKGSFPANYVE